MESAVVADGVRKSYGDAVALDGVSLSVAEGETFALVGPNGAGKTTLVRCLTGTTTLDGGTARLLGVPPAEADPDRLGLLPQEFRPAGRLTARELVGYYAGLYDDAADPEDVLAAVGMAADDGTRYERLSGGQRRRVCVATALVNRPDVLVLDEPTTGIDPAGRRALWELLEDLTDRGTTLLLTTHYMEEAERLADRVGLLAGGGLVAVGPPADLVADHGGPSRLVVETDADPAAVPTDRFAVRAHPDGLAVEGVGPADIGEVVRLLDEHGVEFGALAWTEPDLADVYLGLTGADPVADGREETPAFAGGGRR